MTSRAFPPGGLTDVSPQEGKSGRRLLKTALLAVLGGLLWVGAAFLYRDTCPAFGPATLLLPGETPRTYAYPFHRQNAPRTRFVLIQQLDLPRFHPTTFAFYPQDFLWSVKVNGHDVRADGLPLAAASHEGRSIDLAPFLHSGVNVVMLQMEVRWGEASFRLGVSSWDKYSLFLLGMLACAIGVTTAFLGEVLGVDIFQAEILIVLAGVGIRVIYYFGTPYYVRSFDYWGHIDYLDYVVRHFHQPPPDQNWEAFQPPLYYLLVGGVTKLLLLLGMAENQRYVLWGIISVVFSMGVLAVGYVIAGFLYERGDSRRLYMLAILGVAPPLVFNAARVSNDGLLVLLAYGWLALLLHYWRRPKRATLGSLVVLLGLALLTKANAVSLVLVTGACLLCDRRFEWRSRLVRLSSMLALCGAMAVTYYLPRALHAHEVDTYVVGNLHALSDRARIDDVFLKSLVFNPFKIVRYPFDEAWGPRHDYFPEVFFKTMFLGEWIKGASYKLLGRWMVLIALLLVPFFALGFWQAIRRRAAEEEPLVATLAIVFITQWLFLQLAPYLSTQDFRYSAILLVPLASFCLNGIDRSAYYIKTVAIFLLQVALLNSAIYLLVLAM